MVVVANSGDNEVNTTDFTRAALNDAISGVVQGRAAFCSTITALSRTRKLPTEQVIRLLLGFSGGSLARELRAAGVEATPSAFFQQRAKISPDAFREIFLRFNETFSGGKTFKGYRILAVDGTAVNMPRNVQSPYFQQNISNPKGFCQAHVNLMYDCLNGVYRDCNISADEMGGLLSMLYNNQFTTPTIIVADRGYESYNVVGHLINCKGVDFVLRVKQQHGAMKVIKELPMMELDRDVFTIITTTQTNNDKKNGYVFLQTGSKKGKINSVGTRITRWDFGDGKPYPLMFRVVRFKLDSGEYETLITSLPRDTFSINDLKEIYHLRWAIEISFRALKYNIGLVNFHSRKPEFCEQEIYSSLIMSNFCNRIARAVVVQQSKKNKHEYRVNFTMASHLCREYFQNTTASGKKLMEDIARYTEPVRPGRQDARKLKVKPAVWFTYRVAA